MVKKIPRPLNSDKFAVHFLTSSLAQVAHISMKDI